MYCIQHPTKNRTKLDKIDDGNIYFILFTLTCSTNNIIYWKIIFFLWLGWWSWWYSDYWVWWFKQLILIIQEGIRDMAAQIKYFSPLNPYLRPPLTPSPQGWRPAATWVRSTGCGTAWRAATWRWRRSTGGTRTPRGQTPRTGRRTATRDPAGRVPSTRWPPHTPAAMTMTSRWESFYCIWLGIGWDQEIGLTVSRYQTRQYGRIYCTARVNDKINARYWFF